MINQVISSFLFVSVFSGYVNLYVDYPQDKMSRSTNDMHDLVDSSN